LKDGVDSRESAALWASIKRIKAFEKGLQLVQDASEICDSLVVLDPQEDRLSCKG